MPDATWEKEQFKPLESEAQPRVDLESKSTYLKLEETREMKPSVAGHWQNPSRSAEEEAGENPNHQSPGNRPWQEL